MNQLGHTFLIGTAPVLTLGPWMVPITLIGYLSWEVAQYIRFEADAEDCFEDMAFVASGVFCATELFMLWPIGLFLAAGIAKRAATAHQLKEAGR